MTAATVTIRRSRAVHTAALAATLAEAFTDDPVAGGPPVWTMQRPAAR